MKLLVLGPNYNGKLIVAPNYEGLDRIPYPLGNVKNDIKNIFNSTFSEVEESIDYLSPEGPYIRSINLAERAAKVYSQASGNDTFSVYEITYPFEPSKIKKIFLGYDIIENGNTSWVAYIFGSNMKLTSEQKSLNDKFLKLLNQSLLFSELEDAFHFYSLVKRKLNLGVLSIVGIYK